MSSVTGENLLRELAPQVLGAVIRRFGDFSASEDAVQEALIAATEQWPREGVPDNPRGWLIQVAARRRRETLVAAEQDRLVPSILDVDPGLGSAGDTDDTLILLFMCCHPALTRASAIALTLRAVGGLATAEIASAYLVPEATMAQRISRAKQRIKASGVPFRMPTPEERAERLGAVLHVLYLVFNEGYATSGGPDLQRTDLSNEAIRLARAIRRLLPRDGEVAGLLALMLLTDARRQARTGPDGELVPLAEQDRSLWDRAAIAEGVSLVTAALSSGSVGAYQLQAAIAALHDEASSSSDTDWPQILALYGLLKRMADNPMVSLNHAMPSRWCTDPRPGWSCSTCWTQTSGSPATIASMPSARTCSSAPAVSTTPSPATAPRRTRRRASRNGTTCRRRPRGWRRGRPSGCYPLRRCASGYARTGRSPRPC